MIDTNKLKELELEIFIEIDRICRKNNIQYSMFGGTLIGAARHKGFIPWDDDIDLAMTRENYNKFIKVFEKETNPKYKILDSSNCSDYYCGFIKIVYTDTTAYETNKIKLDNMGVFVDIFPLDKISNSFYKFKVNRSVLLAKPLFILAYEKNYYKNNKSILKNIIRTIISIFPRSFYYKLMNYYAIKDNNKECKKMGFVVGGLGEIDMWPIEYFYDYIELEFEGKKFKAVKEYDELLKHRYGNYMELPPVDQRVGHHNIIAKYK